MTLPVGVKWLFSAYKKKLKAWNGYYETRQRNAFLIFKNNPEKQRLCKCGKCKVKIPRYVPRVFHEMSFWKYHLCPKCALKEVKETIEEREVLLEELKKNLEELKTMKSELEKLVENEDFKEIMSTAYLAKNLEKKPQGYY